jgi:NhaP-type Na+/H+ or K+/H+ antiporter
MFCDATSVVLVISSYNVYDIYNEEERLSEPTHSVGHGMAVMASDGAINFLYIWAVSVGIGLILGVIGSFILKKFTALTENAIAQCSTLFLIACVGYYLGDLLGASGVASLIVSAVVYKNFAWYNMSDEAKKSSESMFDLLKFFGEAIIFSTISVGFFSTTHASWAIFFTIGQFIIITLSRLISVYVVNYSFSCCYKATFTFKEITFINYAGLIRGPVCYGLSLLV